MSPLKAVPGQKLYCSGTFTHRGPAVDPFIAVFFGKARHLELGLWPMVAAKASALGIFIEDDDAETTYSFTIPITITQAMVGKTFDVLRVIAKSQPRADASDLSGSRFDDDWDDDVVSVNTPSASSTFGMGSSGSYQVY